MSFTIYSLSSLVAWLTVLGVGIFVYSHKPRDPINQVFLWLSITITVWVSGCFMESTFLDPDINVLIDKFLYAGAAFAPSAFLHSILVILGKTKERRPQIILSYSCSILFFIVNLFARSHYIVGVTRRISFRYIAAPGIGWYFYILFFSLATFYGLWQLYQAWYKAKGFERKKQVYLFVAYSTVIIAALFYLLLVFNVETPPIDNLLVVIYSLMMAYAITKHELMDIRVVIGRSFAYLIVGILLVASFFGLNSIRMPVAIAMSANAVVALFWAWGAHHLREFIQTPVDKWISWYRPEELLNTIALKLMPVLDQQEAFAIVAEELKMAIKVKSLDFLMGETIPTAKEIQRSGKALIIPFYSSEKIEGGIKLGEKESEDAYDQKDLRFFQTLQVQLLAILDRIRPYEQIKKELTVSQQKLTDTQRQLERSQRLASLGTLTAGVTHEIRNPMAIMKLQTDILFDKPRDETYLKQFQKMIQENIARIQGIVDGMLRMAKNRENEMFGEVNLNELLEKSLNFFTFGQVKLIKELNPIPQIKGHAGDLHRIFINLIQNALEAMTNQQGGVLKIRTSAQDNWVNVEIADNGCGIPPELQERIFDPFFSTRHEGVGLGLSITHRLVEQHKGEIVVQSKVGVGSTFTVRFPVA